MNQSSILIFQLFLKGMADQSRSAGDAFGRDDDMDTDQHILLSRERCLAVVRGLMSLLLSMDFTCHVDLFLVACKVCADINIYGYLGVTNTFSSAITETWAEYIVANI